MDVRRWTVSAIACWKRGGVCSGCIYENFFASMRKCRMKFSVIELVKKLGPPPNEKEQTFILSEEEEY